MSDDEPLIYPGDVQCDEPIRRRSEEDAERELAVDRRDEPVGGAEGGDESRSADIAIDVPDDDDAPIGDTDQHSDDDGVPGA
jgi:hypothetical protein